MAVQPTKTFVLYKGRITIDFYEGKHSYIIRDRFTDDGKPYRPVSVTGITGILDKPALIVWAVGLAMDFLGLCVKLGQKITGAVLEQARVQHKIKKQEAADVGTMVHDWIENYIDHLLHAAEKPPLPEDEKAVNAISAFLAWVKKNNVEFLESESIVYYAEYKNKKTGLIIGLYEYLDLPAKKQLEYSPLVDYVGKMDVRLKLDWNGKKGVKKFGDFKTNNWKENEETGEQESKMYPEQRFQVGAYKKAWEEEHQQDGGGRLLIAINKDNGDFHIHDIETDKFGKTPDPLAYEKDITAFIGLIPAKNRLKELETWGKKE